MASISRFCYVTWRVWGLTKKEQGGGSRAVPAKQPGIVASPSSVYYLWINSDFEPGKLMEWPGEKGSKVRVWRFLQTKWSVHKCRTKRQSPQDEIRANRWCWPKGIGAQACNENFKHDQPQSQYTSNFKELWKEEHSAFAVQKLFLCVRQTHKCPYWHIKRNVNDLQYLPMTLAFIRAVKTIRMSGRPSPFTSHSSSGDNTPPATITESHCISKRPPSSFFTLEE